MTAQRTDAIHRPRTLCVEEQLSTMQKKDNECQLKMYRMCIKLMKHDDDQVKAFY